MPGREVEAMSSKLGGVLEEVEHLKAQAGGRKGAGKGGKKK
jgi:hypothetical protein